MDLMNALTTLKWLFSALVVEQAAAGQRFIGELARDLCGTAFCTGAGRDLEHVERAPRVALCAMRDAQQARRAGAQLEHAKPALAIAQRTLEQRGDVLVGQRLEFEHARAR